ncbi:MAG: zinc ribbon domain-containing protein [Candidatus Aenigmarchaeota archaeon]|nr:zinc ribbon domain-containing protein [Candidatus Aenigmarchaeota archaeon]
MDCPNCGAQMGNSWNFCPSCGARLRKGLFDDIFSKFRVQFDEMNRFFEKDFESIDLTPLPKNAKAGGFSIKIVSSGNKPPQVSVRTFGDVDEKKVREQLTRQMGINHSGQEAMHRLPQERDARPLHQRQKLPATTEEPKARVAMSGNKVMVEMEIPGVKSREDIEIKDLQSSVEVKAFAGDKAYFKIITKPEDFRVTGSGFSEGKLHLELS